ncbi:oligosaccharide flippase family protein [bacterium]|nr:oligosaccharide flippase family protein [bacterium]
MRHLTSYGPAALSRIVGVACTLSLHVLIARSSGPAAYASVAFFVTVFSLAGMLLDFGNEQQLIREGGATSSRARSVLFFAPLLALIVVMLLGFAATPFEQLFSINGIGTIFLLGLPALPLRALDIVPRSTLQRAQRFTTLAWIDSAGSLSGWVVALIVFFQQRDPAAYGLYTTAMYTVRLVLYWRQSALRMRDVQGTPALRQYFGSWRLLLVSAGDRLTTTYDDFAVARGFGPAMLGVYHLSYRVITLVQDFLAGVLRVLSYPVYAETAYDRELVYRQFCLDTRLVFAVTAPLLVWTICTADWGIPLLLTARWNGAVLIFQLLALEALRQSLLPLAGQALIAISHERVLLRFTLVSVGVLLPAFTILAFFDLTVFVVGFLLINSVLNLYFYIEVRRAFAFPVRQMHLAWLPGLLAAVLTGVLHMLLRAAGLQGAVHAILLFAFSLVLITQLYRLQFADIGVSFRQLLRRRAGEAESRMCIVHTDAAFAEDNPHLKHVHEALMRMHEDVRILPLHYRNDVTAAWKRRLRGGEDKKNMHILHIHFPVICYQGKSLSASVARGSRYLLLITLLRVSGMHFVVSLHDAIAHDFPFRRWEAVFLTLLFQSADAIFTYSQNGVDEVARRYGRTAAVHRLRHAAYRTTEVEAERNELRRELGITADHRILLMFGEHKPYKGYAEFVRSLRDQDTMGITLLCAGKGMQQLESVCADAGIEHVIVDAYLTEERLAALIEVADYGVLPYQRILHSGSAVYLLSHGCPIIVPARGVFPEYFAEYAVGVLMSGSGRADIAEMLERVRIHERHEYQAEIRRFLSDHRIEDAGEELYRAYAAVLRGFSGENVAAETAK